MLCVKVETHSFYFVLTCSVAKFILEILVFVSNDLCMFLGLRLHILCVLVEDRKW